ncbi:MAG: DUF4214 domain-containing protein [Burkholderiaceae bacterium]|nr:DUF4214 domain-containing protein [Burkholderiaceae bacterium]
MEFLIKSVNPKKHKKHLASMMFLLLAAGCGGGSHDANPNNAPQSNKAPQSLASASVDAPDYVQIVQQLYISYFGRPADPTGLDNFKTQLAALGGPTDIQQLDQAYRDNPGIKALVDGFGASAESAALYSGDNGAFVTAIYNNVLNRAPDSEGLAFWVGALNSAALTRANASLAIMAGGLANTSVQGRLDADLIGKKVMVGRGFTDALVLAPVNGYDGDAAAAKARRMLSSLTAATDIQAFQSTIATLVSDLASAVNPNPQVPPSTSLAQYAGTYSGTYSGDDYGTFSLVISPSGVVALSGRSIADNLLFFGAGQIASDGVLVMSFGSVSTGATFSGFVNSNTSELTGTWENAGAIIKGGFTGKKNPVQ